MKKIILFLSITLYTNYFYTAQAARSDSMLSTDIDKTAVREKFQVANDQAVADWLQTVVPKKSQVADDQAVAARLQKDDYEQEPNRIIKDLQFKLSDSDNAIANLERDLKRQEHYNITLNGDIERLQARLKKEKSYNEDAIANLERALMRERSHNKDDIAKLQARLEKESLIMKMLLKSLKHI